MIEGRVRRLIYNAREDVDGWELEGGELIHFPPHIGEQLGEWIDVKNHVCIEGEWRTNRDGIEMLYAHYVESQGWVLEFEPPPAKGPPPRRQSASDKRPADDSLNHPTNAEIMQELKAIRRMIEALRQP